MRTLLIAVFVVLSALVLGLAAQLGAFETEEHRIIPLNTVYATFTQEGLRSADEAMGNADYPQVLSAIREAPQQLVLCIGTDVIAAVKSSASSFFSAPEELIVSKTDTMWAAAYLGSDGSLPPAFRIQAVEVRGKTIRIAYERDESTGRSCDLRAYLIWVPIGPVEVGSYTLELFDTAADSVTGTRVCQVRVK